MTQLPLVETYDPEKDAPDFDRPLLRTGNNVEFLHAPRLPAHCPAFVLQALGYAHPVVPRFHRFVGVLHAPAGITIFDSETTIETGSEEPIASRRHSVLSAWLQSNPMDEATRGHNIGDGEIPAHRCDVITADLATGNLWILPFETARAVIDANIELADWDDITETQAVDLFYSWLSGEIS